MGNCIHCGEQGVDHRHYANCPELVKKEKGEVGIMEQIRTPEGIEAKVLGFLAEGITKKTVITLDDTIESLGYDYIDILDIIMDMEESFEIKISEEDYKGWVTVQDIVDDIVNLTKITDIPDSGKKHPIKIV
jgi:acyl carrier protein